MAALESALRARTLDHTLTTSLPSPTRCDVAADRAPTGIAALDASLRGGLPRGHLSEIVGPRSSGRTTLLLQILAAATRRGEIVAVIDTFDRLDVAAAVAAGIDLTRLLWIRGAAVAEHGGLLERAVDRALKALNLVLQAGGFGCVAIDLADVPRPALARIPFSTWLRVQRVIEDRDTSCVILGPQPLARSAGGLTVSLRARVRWAGDTDRSRHVCGADVTARVVSSRRREEREVEIRTVVTAPH